MLPETEMQRLQSLDQETRYTWLKEQPISYLFELIRCKYTLLGDEASEVVEASKDRDEFLDFLSDKLLPTSKYSLKAITRISNILGFYGKSDTRVRDFHLAMLSDKRFEHVYSCLFKLAFFQDESVVPVIRELEGRFTSSEEIHDIHLAIRALEERDPFIFSPYFHDINNSWQLDPVRFGKRIGPL